MAVRVAVLDANVLYGIEVTDLADLTGLPAILDRSTDRPHEPGTAWRLGGAASFAHR